MVKESIGVDTDSIGVDSDNLKLTMAAKMGYKMAAIYTLSYLWLNLKEKKIRPFFSVHGVKNPKINLY